MIAYTTKIPPHVNHTRLHSCINLHTKKTGSTTKFNSLNMKLLALTSNKPYSYYGQNSADIIQCPLLNSPENIHIHHNLPNT